MVMHCIYNIESVFDWDQHNLRKIKAHRITAVEVEQALSASPILIYGQDADGESRHVYYGETARLRLLAVVLTERKGRIRVITAYELDAGQKTRLPAAPPARRGLTDGKAQSEEPGHPEVRERTG